MLLFGMFLQSLEIYFSLAKQNDHVGMRTAAKLIPCAVTSLLLHVVLNQPLLLVIGNSCIVLLAFRLLFFYLMRSLPLSFSLGEGFIVAQGLAVFLYSCYLNVSELFGETSNDDLTLVLQVGLLGVLALILITHIVPIFQTWFLFYLLLLSVLVGVCCFPIHNQLAVNILISFIFSDVDRIVIVGIYIALLILAGMAVTWQINKGQQGTTSTRKIFHILIVLVFVPGLIFQCQFLYVASVIVLAIFIVLELARVISLFPVADALQSSIAAFIDEKDAGKVALTPIYLLVGCSAPLWIHHSPCKGSTELLPLLSGVLSIGIGDTFASVIGSKLGRHKWPKSSKSVEGTIASILAQAAFIYALSMPGYLPLNMKLVAVCGVAIIFNSLIEALTDQVDNLVLPIVTYIILAFK